MNPLRLPQDGPAWLERFKAMGACWAHDGNPSRPHALLTSGKHSDGFLNGDLVKENPVCMDEAAADLVNCLQKASLDLGSVDCVIGPAMGAITLAHVVAFHIGQQTRRPCRTTYAEKFEEEDLEGKKSTRFGFDRTRIIPGEKVLIVEDVVTTGGSTQKVANAIRDGGGTLLPFVGALVNRSGKTGIGELTIASLTTFEPQAWDAVVCPLCAQGSKPVRPKANWEEMTRAY